MVDEDGTAVNKKERLVPESLLLSYINSALRFAEFKQTGLDFSSIPAMYWEQFPRDRIMQMYV